MSVVVPLHNKSDFVTQCLESVVSQTYTDWECIIVDDGSTDDSVNVVESFIFHNPGRWTFLKQPNSGQASTRNLAISKSRGTFIAFLDADDVWPANKLQMQVEALSKADADCILNPYIVFDINGPKYVVRHRSIQKLLQGWITLRGYGGGLESVGLIRTSTMLNYGFNEELSTASGLELCIRLWKNNSLILGDGIGLYYRRLDGQWHRNFDLLSKDMQKVIGLHFPQDSKRFSSFIDAYVKLNRMSISAQLRYILFSIMKLDFAPFQLVLDVMRRRLLAQFRLWIWKLNCPAKDFPWAH